MGCSNLRKGVERVFTIPFSNEEEQLDLIDELCDRLSFVELHISSKPGLIRICVRGSHDMVRRAGNVIREVVSNFKNRRFNMGFRVFQANWLSRETGYAISLQLLSEILKRKGYTCTVNGDRLKTDADKEIIIDTVRLVGSIYDDLKFETKSSSVKKLIASASSVVGSDFWSVLNAAISLDLIGRDERGLLIPLKDWRNSLDLLITYLKSHG